MSTCMLRCTEICNCVRCTVSVFIVTKWMYASTSRCVCCCVLRYAHVYLCRYVCFVFDSRGISCCGLRVFICVLTCKF